MRIDEFSIGDVIQRVEPASYAGLNDRSYMGQPYELKWLEKNVIFLKPLTRDIVGRMIVDLPMESWGNGWDYYPIEMAIELGVVKLESMTSVQK